MDVYVYEYEWKYMYMNMYMYMCTYVRTYRTYVGRYVCLQYVCMHACMYT